jgi:hypothetical protein
VPSRLQFLSVDILAQRLDRAALALNLPADLAGALLALVCPERYGERPAPRRATGAPTGTGRKLRAMARRVARGETCFHPRDESDCGARPCQERRSARDPARRVRGGRAAL